MAQVTNQEIILCKYCGSINVSKYGQYGGIQLYWCKICQRKFKGDNALFHMKVNYEYVKLATYMRSKGTTIEHIRQYLRLRYNYYPSKSVVWRWLHPQYRVNKKRVNRYKPSNIYGNGCEQHPNCFECPEPDCILGE